MRTMSSAALLTTVLWLVPVPSAGADAALQAQLPPAPPLVPERSRPRQPVFPTPQFPQPFPAPQFPQRQPRASVVEGGGFIPQVVCGMRMVPVDPAIDPKFVIPVPGEAQQRSQPPEAGAGAQPPLPALGTSVEYTMRRIVPPIPCR